MFRAEENKYLDSTDVVNCRIVYLKLQHKAASQPETVVKGKDWLVSTATLTLMLKTGFQFNGPEQSLLHSSTLTAGYNYLLIGLH